MAGNSSVVVPRAETSDLQAFEVSEHAAPILRLVDDDSRGMLPLTHRHHHHHAEADGDELFDVENASTQSGPQSARMSNGRDMKHSRQQHRQRRMGKEGKRKLVDTSWRFFDGSSYELGGVTKLPALRPDTPTAELEMKAIMARSKMKGTDAASSGNDAEPATTSAAGGNNSRTGSSATAGVPKLPQLPGSRLGATSKNSDTRRSPRATSTTKGGSSSSLGTATKLNGKVVPVSAVQRMPVIGMSKSLRDQLSRVESAMGDGTARSSKVVPSTTPTIGAIETMRENASSSRSIGAGAPASSVLSSRTGSPSKIPRPPPRGPNLANGYSALRHNPPLQGELLPIERPREVLLASAEELLGDIQTEIKREMADSMDGKRGRNMLTRSETVLVADASHKRKPQEDSQEGSIRALLEENTGTGSRTILAKATAQPSDDAFDEVQQAGTTLASAGPQQTFQSSAFDLAHVTTVDLSVSPYARLQQKTDLCMENLRTLVPLGPEESIEEELDLDTKASLRRQYRSLHPLVQITEASNVPDSLCNILTATQKGISVPLQHEGKATKHHTQPAPPRDIDCVYIKTFDGTLLAHADAAEITQLSASTDETKLGGSELRGRAALIADLRAKQREAEELLGITNINRKIPPPPLIEDYELVPKDGYVSPSPAAGAAYPHKPPSFKAGHLHYGNFSFSRSTDKIMSQSTEKVVPRSDMRK